MGWRSSTISLSQFWLQGWGRHQKFIGFLPPVGDMLELVIYIWRFPFFFKLKLWRFCRIFFFFSPKNILCRIRTAFDAKWQNFIPRKKNSGLVKRSVPEWLSSTLSNLILCRNAKQPSNSKNQTTQHFYAGTVIFSPVRFDSMPEWSPSPLLRNNYMPEWPSFPTVRFVKSFRISCNIFPLLV